MIFKKLRMANHEKDMNVHIPSSHKCSTQQQEINSGDSNRKKAGFSSAL